MTPRTLTILSLATLLAACGDKDSADDTGASSVVAGDDGSGDDGSGDDSSGDDSSGDDSSGDDSSGDDNSGDDTASAFSYECGWDAAAPSDLVSTGSEIGDVIADFIAPDQCDDDYRIWDGYGTYTMILSVGFS